MASTRLVGAVKSSAIACVNPKLRAFSRPGLLALLIGASVVAVVVTIFVRELQESCVDSIAQYSDSLDEIHDYVKFTRGAGSGNVKVSMCLKKMVHADGNLCRPNADFLSGTIADSVDGCFAQILEPIGHDPTGDYTNEEAKLTTTVAAADGALQCFGHTFEDPMISNLRADIPSADFTSGAFRSRCIDSQYCSGYLMIYSGRGPNGGQLSDKTECGPLCDSYITANGNNCVSKACAGGSAAQKKLSKPIEWCDAYNPGYSTAMDLNELGQGAKVPGGWCVASQNTADKFETTWVVTTCTSSPALTAFGAASGYSLYAELVATIFFVGLLSLFGVIHPVSESIVSAAKQSVKEAIGV